MRLSACMDLLFVAKAVSAPERIRLARAEGLDAFEFWRWSNKDVDAIRRAMDQTGLQLTGMLSEPMIPMTDPANRSAIVEGVKRSVEVARRLDAPMLIADIGNETAGRSLTRQRAAVVECIAQAAEALIGSGVRLTIEPLNTIVDHPGSFLNSTKKGLDIIDAVARPELRLLYDLYHSLVMGEVPQEVLAGRVDRVLDVHVADHPGRNEPGSGALPLRQGLEWLVASGYSGFTGLEFSHTGRTADALQSTRMSLFGSMN